MRAAVLRELGQVPTVVDVPDQAGLPGVEVSMRAVALSPMDIAVGQGRFARGHPPLPYVIGHEGVGTHAGRQVYVAGSGVGVTSDGLCAERRRLPTETLIPLPDDADPVLAASLGTAGVAGWMAVTMRADVRPGERVVIRGASGAAGRIAVQAARAAGASTVVGVGRAGGRLSAVADLCDTTVADGDDLAARITEASGGPADVLVDFVWGHGAGQALEAVTPGGRVVVAGGAGGPLAEIGSPTVIGRRLNILGYTNFGLSVEQYRLALLELVARTSRNELSVDVTAVGIDHIEKAWLGTRDSTSKYVIDIQEGLRS